MRGSKPRLVIDNEGPLAVTTAPEWMSAEAREEWDRVHPILSSRRMLTAADMGSLENYCTSIGRCRQLERRIQDLGDEVDLKMLRMQDKIMSTCRQLAVEIGLTPTSRSRPAFRERDDSNHNDLFSKLDL